MARGLHCLISDPGAFEPDTNEDLWDRSAELLQGLPLNAFRVQHVPGHQDVKAAESPLDEWTANWNGVADLAARHAHHARPPAFQLVCANFQDHFLVSEAAVDSCGNCTWPLQDSAPVVILTWKISQMKLT